MKDKVSDFALSVLWSLINSFHMHYIFSVKYSSNWYQFSKSVKQLGLWDDIGLTFILQKFLISSGIMVERFSPTLIRSGNQRIINKI